MTRSRGHETTKNTTDLGFDPTTYNFGDSVVSTKLRVDFVMIDALFQILID